MKLYLHAVVADNMVHFPLLKVHIKCQERKWEIIKGQPERKDNGGTYKITEKDHLLTIFPIDMLILSSSTM